MSPAEAAKALRRAARELPRRAEIAVERTLDELQGEAERLSSGSLDRKALRRMGHPYARDRKRKRGTTLNPDFVNSASGTFKRNWRISPVTFDGRRVRGTLYNADPKAPYLEQPDGGPLSWMVPRHPHKAAEAKVAPTFRVRIRRALRGQ